MVDNRAAGFYGIGGAFNFKSGDISGTAANTQDDKMGQGSEYYNPRENQDENQRENENFVDKSAQLRATLSSLAMMNVASVINSKKRSTIFSDKTEFSEDIEFDDDVDVDGNIKFGDELENEYY